MSYTYLAFWGVPCCERFFTPRVKNLLQAHAHLKEAQNPLQADLLIVFGHITQKQAPYLQNLWADFVYPSRSIHFSGCKNALRNYALVESLDHTFEVDTTIAECEINEELISRALESLHPPPLKKKR